MLQTPILLANFIGIYAVCRKFRNVVKRAVLVLIFWSKKLVGANFYAFGNSGRPLGQTPGLVAIKVGENICYSQVVPGGSIPGGSIPGGSDRQVGQILLPRLQRWQLHLHITPVQCHGHNH